MEVISIKSASFQKCHDFITKEEITVLGDSMLTITMTPLRNSKNSLAIECNYEMILISN